MGTEIIGDVDVKIQDQTTEIIDLHLSQTIQNITLNTKGSVDDTVIYITCDSAPTVGNVICLKEDNAFYQGEILSFVDNLDGTYDVTLDTPLDHDYGLTSGCSEGNINLAVNGSVTPVIFTVTPVGLKAGTRWDITRIMGSMLDDTAMDDAKFGGIAKLTNGVVFRKKNGVYKNIFNAKNNNDLSSHMYDVTYADKAAAGTYGLRFRRTFAGQDKAGVTIRLSADDNDSFECIIRDDLTGITTFHIIAQGHVVED